jgi:hypothetical protein
VTGHALHWLLLDGRSPIVWTLTAAALKARREGLLAALVRGADDRQELPDGYRLRSAASDDIVSAIFHTVDAERQCCRFLRFTITVEPNGGPILLDLTGPPGAREFLSALLAL